MRSSFFSSLFFTLVLLTSCGSATVDYMSFIDNDEPSSTPKVFSKGFISKDSVAEFGSIFNKKGDEFYFAIDANDKSEIKYTKFKNGKWTPPIAVISNDSFSFNDPFLTPSEDKLFYISNMPRNLSDTIVDYDIWYSNREGEQWSKPINAGLTINSDADEYYISFTEAGTMYFASNIAAEENRKHDFDIYKSPIKNEHFQTPQMLNDAINSGRYEADVFIAPDESYIIYCAARRSGYGKGDLYISFKTQKGDWSNSVNMGPMINSEAHELCPFVTYDNKYLYYTSNQDVFWVSTSIIDELRNKHLIIN